MRLAWAILLCACSAAKHGNSTPDAPGAPGDGASNGDGGGSNTDVRVMVHDGFTPIANVRVIFAASGGAPVELVTDATGVVTSPMPAGGDVTVIRTYAVAPAAQRYPEIYSYVGVEAGDTLHVGHASDTSSAPMTMTVLVPVASQGTVTVATPCGTGQGRAPSVTLSVTTCPPNIMFYVADSAQEGFTLAAPFAASVDLHDNALAQFLSTTLLTYDVTPDLASVAAEARAMVGPRSVYSTGATRVDQRSVQRNLPDMTYEVDLDETVVGTRAATAGGTQIVATRGMWEPMPVSIDASGNMLPYVRQAPTFAPATIAWTEDGTGTPTAVIATVDVTRGDPNTPPADAAYRRVILAPHGDASLAIPQLSGADATYNPSAADRLSGQLALIGSSGGYSAFRPWAFGVSNLVDAVVRGNSVTLSFFGASAPAL